jgi:two-component system KDP operon response regulator KdpE
MTKQSVLVIDDEIQIRRLLTITLQSNNFDVLEADNGPAGIAVVSKNKPDLILLDLGLPDESGHDVLKHLREWYSNPIIIISVQSGEEDIVRALDNGADDYLVKPFRTGELLARIRTAIRKSNSQANNPTASFDRLTIDYANRVVRKDNETIKLTATEYSILSLLSRNDGKVLTHQFLLKEVWGSHQQNESQYLRVFIAQLRKKIETDPNRPKYILTESGIGYRFIASTTEI